MREADWKEDIKSQVQSFEPDLIAISTTEDMWPLGLQLIEEIETYIKRNKIPVIAGGVFPTFAPELTLRHRLIDMACVGEGENAMIDLCKKIEKNEDYSDVTNLWIKRDGEIIRRNPVT